MTQDSELLSTGLPGLDRILHGLFPGDNVIWQVESIDDYMPFVEAYCSYAARKGRRLIYLRFGRHQELPSCGGEFETHTLDPDEGPEAVVSKIHRTIEKSGRGAWYVFDSLSDLAEAWYGDTMLVNAFLLICPYLYEMEAIAYFAMQRNAHSTFATSTILDTAQVVLDVHRQYGRLYVQPRKVDKRHSPTMYMLHVWDEAEFVPVTSSATVAAIVTGAANQPAVTPRHRLDIWDRTLEQAREAAKVAGVPGCSQADHDAVFHRLVRMLVSREDRFGRLAGSYLSLPDLLDIANRLIGTGRIGGKAVGMLMARAILAKMDVKWKEVLEAHDSFYVGSDVFFTFLVRNGIWWAHERQRDAARFLDTAELARQRILMGSFPDDIQRQFQSMLDYFGQSPIIVRSSSLLEDNFGNAFAGKYESVFCANQGSRETRFHNFLSAVRAIYASSMSEKALTYRAQRGMLDRDEQMALLVQRVSGNMNDGLFYPHVAGVGFSHNPYVWSDVIDPKAGVLRLVFGLGTRAVDRADDDYTRLVALNAPERQPGAGKEGAPQHCQRRVDVLDLHMNRLVSRDFTEVVAQSPQLPVDMFASREDRAARSSEGGRAGRVIDWRLTFDELLGKTSFVRDMREMLAALQRAYDYPVDVEFTANFLPGATHKINLVQCRPLSVKDEGVAAQLPAEIPAGDLFFRAHGAVIGQSRVITVDRVIYVSPAAYGQLPQRDRYGIARLIGSLTRLEDGGPKKTVLLMGPGRWGTTTPSLGVPVAFGEIGSVSVLCEIVAMRDDLVPEVSLGTHFFSELVENDILYLALFPGRQGNHINEALIERMPNLLGEAYPDGAKWGEIVRVVDPAGHGEGRELKLNANNPSQDVSCFFERELEQLR